MIRSVKIETSGLQCPLCHSTSIQINKRLKKTHHGTRNFYKLWCSSCLSIIEIQQRSEAMLRNMLAYRVPEPGKEYEDYSYN